MSLHPMKLIWRVLWSNLPTDSKHDAPKSSHRTRSKEFYAKQPTPDQHTVGLKDINSDILELKSLILHQLVHLLPVRKTR